MSLQTILPRGGEDYHGFTTFAREKKSCERGSGVIHSIDLTSVSQKRRNATRRSRGGYIRKCHEENLGRREGERSLVSFAACRGVGRGRNKRQMSNTRRNETERHHHLFGISSTRISHVSRDCALFFLLSLSLSLVRFSAGRALQLVSRREYKIYI